MNDILNPYIAGAPVVETSMFFGREDVFGWIERSLEGKFVHHILVLHGQRRVGKTSVLKQIPNFLPDKYIQVFFDLQGRTGTTLDRFLWWLASEIVRTLKREHGIIIPRPDPKTFEDTDYFINEFLPGIRPVLGDYVLLMTFDEFDTLDRPEIREKLASPLIVYLRRLIEVEGLNFIFSIGSSGDKLENMQASYTDFFKSALYRKISFLTGDDCQRLVTKPVEGLIKYEKKAVARISEITSGHPYFTQLMCHELFSRCQKTGARTISADDVEAVLEDVVERGTVNLKFVWDEASDLEKWILAALAQMDGGNNQKLAQALTTQRVRFSESDLNSAVIHLRDKDVITGDNRFVIHLMRLWLVANRPTDRVREELVEVNPIANRYIEIGDEYRDRGQKQQAIESYRQALNANPGNLKAQSNIATVYLDRKEYAEAAAAFELALKIDDEDVVAKSGYCEANLALGDAARRRGENEQALALYQKILVINAAHSDARQRSTAIYREQAERQLAAGQEEAALDSFKRALEFTPEDNGLSARYNEILAQKKAKVVSEWLGKAEKALSRQRWDEAAGMVEEAIKVDPENGKLGAKLAEVKDAPRQFKLQGYRREAETAISRGNWEKAIAALETAIQLAPKDASLREQLEAIRSDQLTAQLDLHRKAAGKGMAAGDWEAAIAARQAALKLAPDDPDLKRALEETRQAQRQAQLDLFQKQVDEAITAGKWGEATQTVQAAIKFAPQDTAWKDKLAEVEAARHQAQLDALRAQAEAARKAQNWDEAIAALESYLKLEPSEAKIPAEIEGLRVEKRVSELKAFKAQAESAAKAENWDEAVRAWESYLALEPEDGAGVDDKLQHARKYAKIAGDYAEAQEAIRKKRFGRAIELLQGIIAQEPTYKSTSRLLVEAVEANKAVPFWRRPWVLPAVGIVALTVLGIFFGPQAWNAISTAIANRPVVSTPAAAAAITPTSALDTIQGETPFELLGIWKSDNLHAPDNSWNISYSMYFQFANTKQYVYHGVDAFNSNQPTDIADIVYLNINDSTFIKKIIDIPDHPESLGKFQKWTWRFDNGNVLFTIYEIMDSQDLALQNDTITALATGTKVQRSEMDPAVKTALDTIQSEEPLYQTTFDDWDTDDIGRNAALVNGKLILTSEDENGATLGLNVYPSDSYAVEFELSILGGDTSPGSYCVYEVSNNAQDYEESWRAMSAIFSLGGQTELDHYVHPDQYLELVTGEDRFDFSKSSLITLVFLGDQITAFINGQLAYTAQDPAGSAVYSYHALSAYNQVTCGFEHFKYWDLREMDSAVKTALAAIQSEEPLYQTTFDDWVTGDTDRNAALVNGKLILNSENQDGATASISNLSSNRFAVEFEFRILESGSESHCVLETLNDGIGKSWKAISAGFFSDGEMNLVRSVDLDTDTFENIAVSRYDETKSNTVMLLILGDQITAFVNGQIAYTALNPNGSVIYTRQQLSAYNTIGCGFDNFKIWDLSGVDFSAATTITGPTSSFASILDSIAGKTPDYEDDFSNLSSGWPTQSDAIGETGYQDGAYFISAKSNNECYGAGHPTNQEFSDFVLEMDVRFINQGQGTVTIWFRGNEQAHYGANLSSQEWVGFHKNVNGVHIPLLETEIPSSPLLSWDTLKHLTLIARQDRMAIYVNGELFIALADTSSSQGWFNFGVCGDTPLQALIDNLKIWDIKDLSP